MRYFALLALVGCASATEGTNVDASNPLVDASIDGHVGSGCAKVISGPLASWAFAGQPGSQATTAASTSAPGIVAGDVARSAALTAASGADSINASGWGMTTMIDAATYYTLSITPPAGCLLDVSSISIDARVSGTGPTTAVVATSRDNFNQTSTVSTTAASMPIVSVSGVAAALEVRVYGYGASSAAGTLRLQTTLTVTGALR